MVGWAVWGRLFLEILVMPEPSTSWTGRVLGRGAAHPGCRWSVLRDAGGCEPGQALAGAALSSLRHVRRVADLRPGSVVGRKPSSTSGNRWFSHAFLSLLSPATCVVGYVQDAVSRYGSLSWIKQVLAFAAPVFAIEFFVRPDSLALRALEKLIVFVLVPLAFVKLHDRDFGLEVNRRVAVYTVLLCLLVLPFYVFAGSIPVMRSFYPVGGSTFDGSGIRGAPVPAVLPRVRNRGVLSRCSVCLDLRHRPQGGTGVSCGLRG